MKSLSSGFLASGSICACLLVRRTDGVFAAFASSDVDVMLPASTLVAGFDVGGRTYRAASGLVITNFVSQASLAVDNMDLTVLPDETTYPHNDIAAGRWDSAQFWLFEADFITPSNGINVLDSGTAGQSDVLRSTNKFEFRGLKQALQQTIVVVTSKTCRAQLGDAQCRVDLTAWTHSYTITSVPSAHAIASTAATEVDDYYGEGIATATSGPNAGFSQKIKSFTAGTFTLALPMPYAVAIGDTFTFVAGCRKRRQDCRDKFANILNMDAEPDVPGADLLTADPQVSV